jgi:hypothetical protein
MMKMGLFLTGIALITIEGNMLSRFPNIQIFANKDIHFEIGYYIGNNIFLSSGILLVLVAFILKKKIKNSTS